MSILSKITNFLSNQKTTSAADYYQQEADALVSKLNYYGVCEQDPLYPHFCATCQDAQKTAERVIAHLIEEYNPNYVTRHQIKVLSQLRISTFGLKLLAIVCTPRLTTGEYRAKLRALIVGENPNEGIPLGTGGFVTSSSEEEGTELAELS